MSASVTPHSSPHSLKPDSAPPPSSLPPASSSKPRRTVRLFAQRAGDDSLSSDGDGAGAGTSTEIVVANEGSCEAGTLPPVLLC